MKYDEIVADSNKLKQILIEEGLSDHYLMISLLIELCLATKGIESKLYLQYFITQEDYWVVNCFNKSKVEGKAMKIDICSDIYRCKLPGNVILYTTALIDKSSPTIDFISKEFADDLAAVGFKNYQDCKVVGTFLLLGSLRKTVSFNGGKKAWINFAKRAKNLTAFENIEQFLEF